MTDLKALTIRAAALKTLADAVDRARSEVDVALLEAMDDGDRKRAMHGDANLATVTKSDPTGRFVVADGPTFTAWVAANAPTEVETSIAVRPSFEKALLGRVERVVDPDNDYLVVDRETGLMVDGVGYRSGRSYVSVRQTPEQREATAAALTAGDLHLPLSVLPAIGE